MSQVERDLSRRPDGSLILTEENDGWAFLRHGAERTETSLTDEEARSQYPDRWRNLILQEHKAESVNIDPETAEVFWDYAEVLDPYGVHDLPLEEQCVGREYFARRPGGTLWVWFGDLPDAVRTALIAKHRHELAFPAGLFCPLGR